MKLISDGAPTGWKPSVGERVRGRKGKREVVGIIIGEDRRPRNPRIRGFRSGFVAYFVVPDEGQAAVPINNVEPERCG